MATQDELLQFKPIKRKLVIRVEELGPKIMVVSEREARRWRRRSAKTPQLTIFYDELATEEDIRLFESETDEAREWAEIEAIADVDERDRRALEKLMEDGKL